jgi:putative hemolysin
MPRFQTRWAQNADDLAAAQRLRYRVFVQELGADGPLVDHQAGLERDEFDGFARHLMLHDLTRAPGDQVVGVYRLLDRAGAAQAGRFYCAAEFDLALLVNSDLRLLELGRSCLHPDYRGGTAMMHLWAALAEHIKAEKIDLLFGVASFHGTDLDRLAAPLQLLFARHLAPAEWRVVAHGPGARMIAPQPDAIIDRVAAMRDTPALIKAYLRLGGVVGQGVYVDEPFNTTDLCLILPTDRIDAGQARIYTKAGRHG